MNFAANRGMGGHQRAHQGDSDEWITPRAIVQALGPFDLDPCAPVERPWPTAAAHYTIRDNGLAQPWAGRVWCNPPYGRQTGAWIRRLADHGDGIALIFARTDTAFFHAYVWAHATALFFPRSRIRFCDVAGTPGRYTGGAPSVLVAYGAANAAALERCGLAGAIVRQFATIDPVRTYAPTTDERPDHGTPHVELFR